MGDGQGHTARASALESLAQGADPVQGVAAPMQAHDALFKAVFSQSEHAARAIERMLPPALAAQVDFQTLTLQPGSYVDEALRESSSDLLFSATVRGKTSLFYVVFEHQSTVDRTMAFRLLRYMVRIWETFQAENPTATRLPMIVPIVLHHSEEGWHAQTAFEELLDADAELLAAASEHVPRFRFLLDDISLETDEALKARAMTALGRLVLFCLRHARTPEVAIERLRHWGEIVHEVRQTANGRAAMVRVLRYIFATASSNNPEEVVNRLNAAIAEANEEIMTAAEQLMERGFKKGIDKGIEQGIEKGIEKGIERGIEKGREKERRDMLLLLLRERFEDVPSSVVVRVNAADMDQLVTWIHRGFHAATLASVFDEA